MFTSEADFEESLIKILTESGWEKRILKRYTEEQLVQNWSAILFENNRGIDRLNDYPLTDGEMQQILDQIKELKTPIRLNGFINGRCVSITRDNPNDVQHFGKEVSLKIYDRHEIAAGQSRYQIVQQPQFRTRSKLLNQRRGDLMLLINGMPVIHIELKKSGIPISQAYNQIENYSSEGVYTGIFSLVQIFVAMNPENAVYFANPGPEGKFNSDFYFHWANFNNEPINEWREIASTLLSIPMAHQLIGFYTVADELDGILKVMRSYQYYAANAISDRVSRARWEEKNQRGGFIWHTTGSGKTMTSFKSAQLIASSKDADKVIFLMDRIELGTQSLQEYRGFAGESQDVQATENTSVLVNKLKSTDPANTLIVTSIQKLSNIKDEEGVGMKTADLEAMRSKRIVFIVDECHRSTFGEMLRTIKHAFPNALLFGFTGTPIQEENQKRQNTTATIFGDELHRYSIADGIRDKNVLGFDPYKVLTYADDDLRQAVALEKSKSATVEEAMSDPAKKATYLHYYHLPMTGQKTAAGSYESGIEDYVPNAQYDCEIHRNMVVKDILKNWCMLSQNGKFHAIFATSSIPEAIQYYRLFKERNSTLKVTALFDPNIDNKGNGIAKEEGLLEIVSDYNDRYSQDFSISTFAGMKKDIAKRLSHKKEYKGIDKCVEKQIDILIVVDQMLTGFDSKWVNTLYLDKMLRYENIIQAFSRTNRLFGPEKPFGTIRYYRRPHTMERRIQEAVKLYSGNKPLSLFVEKLDENLKSINKLFDEIVQLFANADVRDFSKLPDDESERKKFAEIFKRLTEHLEAAKIQGFYWDKTTYAFKDKESKSYYNIVVKLDETTYHILALRYKELMKRKSGEEPNDIPYDIEGYLVAIDTDKINSDYMNSRFEKYLKLLTQEGIDGEALQQAEEELHKTFATLTQEEQKYANIFLHDIQRGDAKALVGKTLRDYITEYMAHAKDDQIHQFALLFGLDENLLRDLMSRNLSEATINEFGRFDQLKQTVDKAKARVYFEKLEGKSIVPPKIPQKIDKWLRDFILMNGQIVIK